MPYRYLILVYHSDLTGQRQVVEEGEGAIGLYTNKYSVMTPRGEDATLPDG